MKPQKRIFHIAALLVSVALFVTACGGPSSPAAPEPAITLSTSSGRDLSTGLSWGGTGRNLKFERISIKQGLSHSTMNCILQDSKGFMWFGTDDGLNRYDGHDFTLYKHVPSDPHSLSHNHIKSLHQDQFGTLWVGTVDRLGDDWH